MIRYGTPLVLLLVGYARATEPVPRSWSHSAEVTPTKPGLVDVTVPVDLLDPASPTLHDLRLFRSSGEEIPYSLQQISRAPVQWVPWTSFQSVLENKKTVLTGKGPTGPVDAIRLESPSGEFLKSVALDVFEKKRWKTVWTGRPIYRSFSGPGNLEIEFPARRLGRFRVRVDDRKNDPIPFTGASARMAADTIPRTEKIPAVLSAREDGLAETHLTVSLPGRNLYVDGVTVETPDPLFQRSVRVVLRHVRRESNPGGGQQIIEFPLGHGTLFRAPGENGLVFEDLFVPINARIPAREIHLMITNGDAPPLQVNSLTVHQIPTRLLFFSRDLSPVALAAGHPGAPTARYDWPATDLIPGRATTGIVKENPLYTKPEVVPLLAPLGGAFDSKGWAFRSPVDIKSSGVHALEIPLSVLVQSSPQGRDVRLVRDGRQIPFVYNRIVPHAFIDLSPSTMSPEPKGTTRWEIKLPTNGIPISHVELRAKESIFQRTLHLYEELSTANGDRYARSLARAQWVRSGEQDRLLLSLAGPPDRDRLMLAIQDGDNAPLTLEKVRVYYRTYDLVFKTEPGGPLWLYYGHPDVPFPVYDAAMVSDELLSADKTRVFLGPEEKIKTRWTWGTPRRGETSFLFWAVLVGVTLVLVVVIQRLLPEIKAKP